MKRFQTVVVIGAMPCAAQAQVGTWLWEVTTQDGDAIVEPGESASILLSLDFVPDVDRIGPIFGFQGSEFDVVGADNAELGMIPDDADGHPGDVLDPWDNVFFEQQTSDGTSLFGVLAGQSLKGPFSKDDPAHILLYEWIPDAYGEYQVTYETVTDYVAMWVDPDEQIPVFWDVVEATVVFQVVPSPGAVGCLAMAGSFGCLRRRR
jgi:hypothetical protein